MSVGVQPYGQPVYGVQGYPPPPGYPASSANVVVVTQPGTGRIAAPGSCIYCGIGYPHTSYNMCGIILAILFFPSGIICCLLCCREARCSHCNARL